jgi:hypothetical protein
MVRLTIDRSQIGAYRAMRVFQSCRAYAQCIAPGCYIMAVYENHERVGWMFEMPGQMVAMRLRLFHLNAMQRLWR